jgi:hypothetical protein
VLWYKIHLVKKIRNIISLLSLAAVASSPISGVLAPAGTGGYCVVKYINSPCGWDTDSGALDFEPVIPDHAPADTGHSPLLADLPSAPAFVRLHAGLTGSVTAAQPLYILNQSLLFYDHWSI